MNFAIPFMMSSRSGPGFSAEEKRLYDILSETKRELRELQDRHRFVKF